MSRPVRTGGPVWQALSALVASTIAVSACGGGDPAVQAGAASPAAASAPAAAAPAVPTAEEPADPCGWIPVADVEAVVGKLAEPPSTADGCTYVLAIPESIAAARQEHVKRIEAFRARFKTDVPTFQGSMADFQSNPKSYAVSVSVNVRGDMGGQMAFDDARAMLARQAGVSASREAPPEGWDAATSLPYGFTGRVGHVSVSVQAGAPDVPADVMRRLAAAVRDRIPDLPFATDNPYQIIQLGSSDKSPCDLLPRAEAEAVLGPLVVEPYRSSSQHPPLALAKGHGCAYYTKGHRVFVLVPTWSDGEQTFKLEAGVGGFIGQLLPQESVIFKGPWDKAQPSRTSGALLFLKGDQLLEAHYLTSSTDRGGAVKLAASAMRRLTAS